MVATTKKSKGRRANQKQVNRQEIIDAANRLLANGGPAEINVRRIVRETTLASGTFYNYFRSLDDLLEAIAVEAFDRFCETLNELERNAASFEEFVLAAFTAFFRYSLQERQRMNDIRAPQHTPAQTRISQEIFDYVSRALEKSAIPKSQFSNIAAIAIGMTKELDATNPIANLSQADALAAFASSVFIGSIDALERQAKVTRIDA